VAGATDLLTDAETTLLGFGQITVFDLDDAKARPLVLTAAYRYLSSPLRPR
jgi:hypothetical protein